MAPLTGFFGTNSSGKTAILQFLLMLKQTVESSDRNRILHLGGDQYSYVDLGTTYDISHRHELPQSLKFAFEWLPRNTPESIVYMITELLEEKEQIKFSRTEYSSLLKFESRVGIDNDQVNLEYFKYSFKASDNQWNHIGINVQLNSDTKTVDSIFIDGNLLKDYLLLSDQGALFKKFKLSLPIINNYKIQYSDDMTSLVIINLSNLVFSYEGLFINTYYLGPLREYPKRTYLWSGERPQDVGKYGELTVAALLASRKKDVEVEISVAKALKDLGLIHGFRLNRITPNRGDYEILVQRSPNSAEVLITDVGFGVSQVLPILVLCYYVPKGSTLIFEQPEIHLHPSVQAGLADIFIEVIKTRNIQIIIESHSEHLLRRLQRRIAEAKDGFSNEDAALCFCKMNDQGDSELVTLDIDNYGNICNYPEGFFGDEMGDLVAMTEAAINRQMNIGV
ncbi:MAG: AAA family ATPase [Pseudanabaenaceae cyanobacterium]